MTFHPFGSALRAAAVIAAIAALYMLHAVYVGRDSANYATELTSAVASHNLSYYGTALENRDWGMLSDLVFTRKYPKSKFPPLHVITAAAVAVVNGRDWQAMNITLNTLYLLILLTYTWLLAARVAGQRAGLLAAILVAAYPLSFGAFRMFCLDYPITALAVMTVYHLLEAGDLSRLGHVAAAAVATGWGLMVKEPFAAFVAGPWAVATFCSMKGIRRGDRRTLMGLAAATVIVIAITSPHYMGSHIFGSTKGLLTEEASGFPWYSFDNLRLFTVGLWESQLTPALFILLAVAFVPFFLRADVRQRAVFASWLLIPNLILIFIPHWKTARYLLPQLPALAVITAAGIAGRRRLPVPFPVVVSVVVLLAGMNYCLVVFGGRLLIPLGSGRIPYFRRTELNQTPESIRSTTLVLDALGRALSAELDAVDAGRPGRGPVLFAPYQNGIFPLSMFMKEFLWFSGRDTDLYGLSVNSLDYFGTQYNADNIDLMLFCVPAADPRDYRTEPLRFADVLKTLYRPHEGDDMPGRVGRYERVWSGIIEALPSKRVVFRNGDMTVYLYGRYPEGQEADAI